MFEKVRKTLSLLLVCPVLLLFCGFVQNETQDQNPREIMKKAAAAIKSLNAVIYDAAYTGHGSMGNFPSYFGQVALERISTPYGPRALIAVRGSGFHPGEPDARFYSRAYDGETVRWLDPDARQLLERKIPSHDLDNKSWGEVTGHLGRAAASTVLWEFISEDPFTRALNSAILEYQGSTVVSDELCHIIYQEETDPTSKRKRMQQWYISVTDFLPRRHESLSNRDSRIGALVLNLSNVRKTGSIPPDTFKIVSPAGFSTASYQKAEKVAEALIPGEPAPEWSAVDALGQKVQLSDFKGRIVVLDFWAEWCVPCKEAMPVMQRLHEKYADRGVTVLGIHCFAGKGGKPPMDYIRLKQFTYRQIPAGDEIAKKYKVGSLPTLYVIDKSGLVTLRHIGFKQNLEADLIRTLDGLTFLIN